jgi:hypothetical protein
MPPIEYLNIERALLQGTIGSLTALLTARGHSLREPPSAQNRRRPTTRRELDGGDPSRLSRHSELYNEVLRMRWADELMATLP